MLSSIVNWILFDHSWVLNWFAFFDMDSSSMVLYLFFDVWFMVLFFDLYIQVELPVSLFD